MALNRWQKDTCLQNELKQWGRVLPCSTSAWDICIRQLKIFTLLYIYECVMIIKVPWLLIWRLQINFNKWTEFANMESLNNEDWLYIYIFSIFLELVGFLIKKYKFALATFYYCCLLDSLQCGFVFTFWLKSCLREGGRKFSISTFWVWSWICINHINLVKMYYLGLS